MFVRPAAVTIIAQPSPIPKPPNGTGTAKKPGRPSSIIVSGLGRRLSSVPDAGAGKRMSMNATSPSPAIRGSRPSSMLRVGLTQAAERYFIC
jgi:dynactin 1